MPLLDVLTYPDKRLRIASRPVTRFDDDLKATVADMVATMYAGNGVGLASNQVNVRRRIIVLDVSESRDNPCALINPVIVKRIGTITSREGCLSVPGRFVDVKRAKRIKMRRAERGRRAGALQLRPPAIYGDSARDRPLGREADD